MKITNARYPSLNIDSKIISEESEALLIKEATNPVSRPQPALDDKAKWRAM